jgi:hypothetical protein
MEKLGRINKEALIEDVVNALKHHAHNNPDDRQKLGPVLEQLATTEKERNPKS